MKSNIIAEVVIKTSEFEKEVSFFENKVGFKLKEIFPADSPKFALLEGFGINIFLKLEKKNYEYNVTHIRIKLDENSYNIKPKILISPGGNKVEFYLKKKLNKLNSPSIFEINQNNKSWSKGRAGMLYRDLLPLRYGNSVIASHIKLETIGRVNDKVHYHDVNFQVLYCLKGKVKLAYENQKNYIIFQTGDCILQPPQIKHQVIETYEPLEVIEITSPAEHITKFDYNLALPNKKKTSYDKQSKSSFLHYVNSNLEGTSTFPNFTEEKTGIYEASSKYADLIIKKSNSLNQLEFLHNNILLFFYILDGSLKLILDNKEYQLTKNHSFALPPNKRTCFITESKVKFLQLSIPGKAEIRLVN